MDNRKSKFKRISYDIYTQRTVLKPIFLRDEKNIYKTEKAGEKLEYALKVGNEYQLAAKPGVANKLKGLTIKELQDARKLKGYKYKASGYKIVFDHPLPRFKSLTKKSITDDSFISENDSFISKNPIDKNITDKNTQVPIVLDHPSPKFKPLTSSKKRTADDSFISENSIDKNITDKNTQVPVQNGPVQSDHSHLPLPLYPNVYHNEVLDYSYFSQNKVPAYPYPNQNEVPDYSYFYQNKVSAYPYFYQNIMPSIYPYLQSTQFIQQTLSEQQKFNDQATQKRLQARLNQERFYPPNYFLEVQQQQNLVNPFQYSTMTQQPQLEENIETQINNFNPLPNPARTPSTLFFDSQYNESEKQTKTEKAEIEKVETQKPQHETTGTEKPESSIEFTYGNFFEDMKFEEDLRNTF